VLITLVWSIRDTLEPEEQEVARVSDWVKVSSAPDETSASLMEGVLKDAGIPVLIRRISRGRGRVHETCNIYLKGA
jgi:hypothetical protein